MGGEGGKFVCNVSGITLENRRVDGLALAGCRSSPRFICLVLLFLIRFASVDFDWGRRSMPVLTSV